MSEQPAAADNGFRIHEALKLAEGFGFPGGLYYYDELDLHGMAPLLYRLTDGAWHATGRPVRDGNREPGPPEILSADSWRYLIPDAHTDSAEGGGRNFCDIRIYRGAPSPPAKQTNAAEVECYEWLAALMAEDEKTKTKDEYQDDAICKFGQGLGDRAFNRAWKRAVETTPQGSPWRKPGRIKNS